MTAHSAMTAGSRSTTAGGFIDDNRFVSVGVEGLDDVLGGGLTPDRLYLLEGAPGSGKTTLALQFLLKGRSSAGPPASTVVEAPGRADPTIGPRRARTSDKSHPPESNGDLLITNSLQDPTESNQEQPTPPTDVDSE